MNLDEFMNCGARSGYISEDGFESLYVRRSFRYLPNKIKYAAFDIASVQVTHPGNGTFRRFVARVRRDYPDLTIYVESVLSDRFKEGLLRMGFAKSATADDCFVLPPDHILIIEEDHGKAVQAVPISPAGSTSGRPNARLYPGSN